MNRRQCILQVRTSIEKALPGAPEESIRLWFCRLCALRYMEVSGMLPDARHMPVGSMRLFAETGEAFPAELVPAMLCLRTIPAEEWQGHPELAGWLYQYYNFPERETCVSGVRQGKKIPSAYIPAATQLFTPDWIVRYMVQNALGTVCKPLPEWKYYLASENPLPPRSSQTLRILDPCMGTGHILAYVFDALIELYLAEGFPAGKAAEQILTCNLCGLDIDDAAVQLSEFVLLMKAAQFIPDILHKGLHLRLYSFKDAEGEDFANAEVFGSLLKPGFHLSGKEKTLSEMLRSQYDAVITNPPYMGSSGMSQPLSGFVRANYPEGKADLFAAFMLRCAELTAENGCFSMITQHAWMFLSSYQKLRRIMERHTLLNMIHLGARAFSQNDVGTIVQTTAFTALGREVKNLPGTYLRLTEQEDKETAFFDPSLRYVCTAERFAELPGSPLCYWVSDRMLEVMQAPKLSAFCKICQGMTTSDNKRFLRRWYEVTPGSTAFGCKNAEEAAATSKTWFPYNKGGRLRRWYGNHSWVVNYRNNGEEMRSFHAVLNLTRCGGRLKNADMYFKPALTWPFITESTRFGVRVQPAGFLFDVSGSCLFPAEEDALYLAGFLSSSTALELLKLSNPTMNFQVENLSNLPVLFDRSRQPEIEALVTECIRLAKEDWDSTEESWDFTAHPLVRYNASSLEEAFACYRKECEARLDAMQRCEEQLNRIFAEIYGLTGEIDCRPPKATLRQFQEREAAEALISFAVGCLFGRYALPGGTALEENFLPLSELPAYLRSFLGTVFEAEQLPENEAFLERTLGETLAHYCSFGFYAAHCRKFHKRPLYWLASSGRKQTIHGLCYVHRMGESPVPLLRRIVEKAAPSSSLAAYRKKLSEAAQLRFEPDAGIQENHEKFRSIFAAIR